jgi:hypothetical protein
MTDAKMPKNAEKFHCQNCDFKCCKKSNYVKHLLTPKHKNTDKILTNTDAESSENATVTNNFICSCGKEYKHRQSLFNHKKKCQPKEEIDEIDKPLNEKEIIMTLLNQNNQLQNQIIELCKENKSMITNNITNTNSHNKTFNLNVFLNETCKDAMNIMDFVDSIKLQLTDLEKVGKIGYIEGISNIIVKNLNSLDETKRPVHCTDTKREVMYIKDDDKWEKENENKQKMRKVIKHIAHKNSKLLNEFKNKHPDCGKSDSKYSDQYNKLVIEAMGGKGDNDLEKENKIIKNIVKEVTIDSKA